MKVKKLADPIEAGAGATLAFVIHPDTDKERGTGARSAAGQLEETVDLARALALDVRGEISVRLTNPRAGWLFGKGKVEELGALIAAAETELVIVNGKVTPRQQQNLEKSWKVKILDRTGLILEIFADRAQTREGTLQVELAHLEYQRGRLVRSWTHLERQRGGLGFVGGPGETQIEADRRALDLRMTKIKRQLEKTVRTRGLQRGARKRVPFPVVALVGYTNAGKSTLFNRVTGATVTAEDMLFATLDPTMRGVVLPGGRTCILSDTVGFIADLPTQLIAAFRATLEEVLEADLIVHVRDVSHEEADAQDADVRSTLTALGLDENDLDRMIVAHNKVDLLAEDDRAALMERIQRRPNEMGVSALKGVNTDILLERIEERIGASERRQRFDLRSDDGEALAWLYRHCTVLEREDREDTVCVAVSGEPEVLAQFTQLYIADNLS